MTTILEHLKQDTRPFATHPMRANAAHAPQSFAGAGARDNAAWGLGEIRARAADNAREVTDQWFFETLVRLHRAGEGATFEGLKPAGWKPPEAVAKADEAIAKGNIESLEALLETAVRTEIRVRFRVLLRARELRNDSVDAGRRYVDAYTGFMHYVERLVVSPPAREENHDH